MIVAVVSIANGSVESILNIGDKVIASDRLSASGQAFAVTVDLFTGEQTQTEYTSTFSAPDGTELVDATDAVLGGTWTEQGGFAPPAPIVPTKNELSAYANKKQWELATGGFTATVAGTPCTFETDTISQGLITGKAVRFAQVNPPASVDWQFATGFVTISASDFMTAAIAVADFVQSTFDALKTVFAAIQADTITDTAGVDAAAWPANHQ
jgi:hypothetical protein